MRRANIVRTIRQEAGPFRERTAVVEGDRSISYAALFDGLDAVGVQLRAQGIGRVDRVAFLCDDSIDYVLMSLAVLSVEAVVVPLSPSLTADEIANVLERMDVHAFLFDAALFDAALLDGALFEGILPDGAGVVSLENPVAGGRRFRLAPRGARGEAPAGYGAINPAFIRFSSGTTGMSKGVLLSHESILERTDAADAGLRMTSDDVVLWILSMSYHFVVTILLFLRRATTIVICRSDSLPAFREGLERHRGTFVYASPFYYHMLTASREITADALAGVRMAISTATNLPQSIADAYEERFGKPLAGAYGIIEVGLPCIDTAGGTKAAAPGGTQASATGGGKGAGSVGRVLPAYEIRIENPDADGIGAILVRGKGMFDAYFSPWRTREEALDDGWFRTGDMGTVAGDGELFIVGREKNVIIFSGMKIFPYEVEAVLDQHPAVRESLVHGVEHPVFGQLPAAKLVLEEGGEGDDLVNRLRRFCYERLASYKVPKSFEIVSGLERTASNKLVRR